MSESFGSASDRPDAILRKLIERYVDLVQQVFISQRGKPLSEDELLAFFDPGVPTPDLDRMYKDGLFPKKDPEDTRMLDA